MSTKPFNFGTEDRAIQKWGGFSNQDEVLYLDHLNAHIVEYVLEPGTYKFYVTYSHHCFTKTELGNDSPNLLYHHHKDSRHFHHERYHLSLQLPDIIRELPTRFVFHGGRKDHYCTATLTQSDGTEVDYLIVFTVFRSIRKLRLHVTSAYPKKRGKARKVKFESIVKALQHGRKLPGQ